MATACRTAAVPTPLEVGTRIKDDVAYYSDIDVMTLVGGGYAHRDGTPYPRAGRRSEKR